jgi:hypothetical protein
MTMKICKRALPAPRRQSVRTGSLLTNHPRWRQSGRPASANRDFASTGNLRNLSCDH